MFRTVLWSTSTNQLAVPLFNLSTVSKRSFPLSGATFWNSLPPHVTSSLSLAIFRQRLKTFLFHLSYPDLICCTALFVCGPCDNFCYLDHTKKIPIMMMIMMIMKWYLFWFRLTVTPHSTVRRSGDRVVSSSSGVRGWERIWCILALKSDIWWHRFY